MEHPVIFFDGVCNLCNGAVQFVIRHDRCARFRFASLQQPAWQKVAASFGISNDMHSFVLWEDGKLFMRSTAALRVARRLDGGWKALYALMIVPRFLRDGVYDFIAKHRYTWFGKRDSCMIPNDSLRSRFIDPEN